MTAEGEERFQKAIVFLNLLFHHMEKMPMEKIPIVDCRMTVQKMLYAWVDIDLREDDGNEMIVVDVETSTVELKRW